MHSVAQGTSTNGVARREARAFPTCPSPKKPVPFGWSLYSGRNPWGVQRRKGLTGLLARAFRSSLVVYMKKNVTAVSYCLLYPLRAIKFMDGGFIVPY